MKLLTIKNPKTLKGEAQGYLTAILHLAPASLSGRNVCPWSTAGCREACINTSGYAGMPGKDGATNPVQLARLARTALWWQNRSYFVEILTIEIQQHRARAERVGFRAAVRLNGTSDIPWEKVAPQLFTIFPDVQFYDYTKGRSRMATFLAGNFPTNYHLTFSRTESNDADCLGILANGGTVAIVQMGPYVPGWWCGASTIDGDASDLRFLDPPGSIVALKAKGRAKNDRTGFVIR